MKTLTGAIVDRFDESLTTLQNMISAMYAGQLPEEVELPYVSVTEIESTRVTQVKGFPGATVNRAEVLFDVYGTGKHEVHLILRQLERDYLNTVLSVVNRSQLGRPLKIGRNTFQDGDLWVGQLSLAYQLQKAGA